MSKHTPGPWVVGEQNKGPVAGTVPVHTADYMEAYRGGQLVCSVYGTAAFSEANARLIAAAPEMLDALKKTSEFLHHMWCSANINEYDFEMVEETMLINDAAIAKATGDQP